MNSCPCGNVIFGTAEFCSATCWDLYYWDLETKNVDETDPNEV